MYERRANPPAAVVTVAAVCLLAGSSSGDCGSIPFRPHVKIFEPNQRALIAWNGREEILVLSTDLSASEPTKVLEVIPLPSRPTVCRADVAIFRRAIAEVNRKAVEEYRQGWPTFGAGVFGGGPEETRPRPPAGKVTLHRRIGAVDISILQLLDGDRFVAWVERYLQSRRVRAPKLPGPLKQVIAEYIHDGYSWFAFNVVALGPRTHTKQAVRYRFRSDKVYYPMRITRAESGWTDVSLVVLSPADRPAMDHEGLSPTVLASYTLQSHELERIDRRLLGFMGYRGRVDIDLWHVEGALAGFQKDILAGPLRLARRFFFRDMRTNRMSGPVRLLDRTPVRLGNRRYTINETDTERAGAAPGFKLRTWSYGRFLGPFGLGDGQVICLPGDRGTYLLVEERPSRLWMGHRLIRDETK